MLFLCNIANFAETTFEMIQKLRSRKHGERINFIDKNVEHASTSCARESPKISMCEGDIPISATPNSSTPNFSTLPHFISTWLKLIKR